MKRTERQLNFRNVCMQKSIKVHVIDFFNTRFTKRGVQFQLKISISCNTLSEMLSLLSLLKLNFLKTYSLVTATKVMTVFKKKKNVTLIRNFEILTPIILTGFVNLVLNTAVKIQFLKFVWRTFQNSPTWMMNGNNFALRCSKHIILHNKVKFQHVMHAQ